MQLAQGEQQFFDAREVALRLGVGERTVWRWTAIGTLPKPVKLGRLIKWRRADILAFEANLEVIQ